MATAENPPADGATRRRGLPIAFLPLALTYLAVAMNMTIPNVALPTISQQLEASTSQLSWIVNITPLAAAALILFAGSWGDRYGRRRLLVAGIAVFLVAAVLSGLATSADQLVALRALTGVGSALTMPAALALTFDVVEEASQTTAVGILSATQAVGALLGPIVAGSLLLAFSWGSAFLSVTPLLGAALVMVWWKVPPDRPSSGKRAPLDSLGAGLMAVAGAAFIYAAVTWTDPADDVLITPVVALVLGSAAAVALVLWEIRCPHPLFVAKVLRGRTFWVPTLIIFTVQFVLGGVLFLNTQYVQLALGFSAFTAGLFLVPALITWTASAATAGLTARRLGMRFVVTASLFLSGIGLLLVSMGGLNPNYAVLLLGMLLAGAMGVAPALTTHMAVAAYPEERRSVGSAINAVAIRFGLAFGVAVFGSILASEFASSLRPDLTGLSSEQSGLADNSLGGALQVAQGLDEQARAALELAARIDFALGFRTTMLAAAVLLVGLAVVAGLWLPRARAGAGDTEESEAEPRP